MEKVDEYNKDRLITIYNDFVAVANNIIARGKKVSIFDPSLEQKIGRIKSCLTIYEIFDRTFEKISTKRVLGETGINLLSTIDECMDSVSPQLKALKVAVLRAEAPTTLTVHLKMGDVERDITITLPTFEANQITSGSENALATILKYAPNPEVSCQPRSKLLSQFELFSNHQLVSCRDLLNSLEEKCPKAIFEREFSSSKNLFKAKCSKFKTLWNETKALHVRLLDIERKMKPLYDRINPNVSVISDEEDEILDQLIPLSDARLSIYKRLETAELEEVLLEKSIMSLVNEITTKVMLFYAK